MPRLKNLAEIISRDVPDRLIRKPELARILDVSVSWINAQMGAGTLPVPVVRIGSGVRFRLSDAMALVSGKAA